MILPPDEALLDSVTYTVADRRLDQAIFVNQPEALASIFF